MRYVHKGAPPTPILTADVNDMIKHKKLFWLDNRITRLIQDFITLSPYKVGRLLRNQRLSPPVPLRAFTKSNHGILAVFFALGAIPLKMAIGAAVDFGRAFTVKAQLGEALDKAALAVALAPKGTKDADLDKIFKGYFDAINGFINGIISP